MNASDDYVYDIAFSFLSQDVGIAQEMGEHLRKELKVFVYSRRQEELAGTDGLEKLRPIFRHKARIVAVLFRSGWGETPWTRFEHEVIKERYLDEGKDFLFFALLDEAQAPPWLPENYISFDFSSYGVAEAVGALKFRVQQVGGVPRKETVAERARRIEAQFNFSEETKALWCQDTGVREVEAQVTIVIGKLSEALNEAGQTAPSLKIETQTKSLAFGARSSAGSLLAHFHRRYSNSLEGVRFTLEFYRQRIKLPGEENLYYIGGQPPPVAFRRSYKPARTRALGWCWETEAQDQISSANLALQIVTEFLDHVVDSRQLADAE